MSDRQTLKKDYPDPMNPGQFKATFTDFDNYHCRWASHHDVVEKVLDGRYDLLTPKVSEFIPTLNCPYRCPTCQFKEIKIHQGVWKKEMKSRNVEMDLSSAKFFLEQLIESGCIGIHFTGGGEPTYHPHFYDIAKYAKEMGGLLSISSNGTFLGGIEPEQIIDLEFHRIRISLDTIKKHAIFHGYHSERNLFQVVLNNIKRMIQLKAAKSGKTQIIICIVFDQRNYEEIPELGHAIAELGGVDHVVIRPVQDYYNKGKHVSKAILQKSLEMIQGEFKRTLSNAGIKVYVPAYRLTVFGKAKKDFSECRACGLIGELFPDGSMYLCTETSGINDFSIGSLSGNTLKGVYSSDQYQSVRLGVGHDNFQRCPVTARPLELNNVFQKIENLRTEGKRELIKQWLNALHSMHANPNPWIMI